jgi:hypothetical protein
MVILVFGSVVLHFSFQRVVIGLPTDGIATRMMELLLLLNKLLLQERRQYRDMKELIF